MITNEYDDTLFISRNPPLPCMDFSLTMQGNLKAHQIGLRVFYLELGAVSGVLVNKQRAFERKATHDFLPQAELKVQN